MNIVSYCIPFVSLFLSPSIIYKCSLITRTLELLACWLLLSLHLFSCCSLARCYGETIEISITEYMLHLHSCAHFVVIAIANCCLHFFD